MKNIFWKNTVTHWLSFTFWADPLKGKMAQPNFRAKVWLKQCFWAKNGGFEKKEFRSPIYIYIYVFIHIYNIWYLWFIYNIYYLYTIHWAFGRCVRSGVLVTTWSHTALCDHGAQRAHYISMREKNRRGEHPQFLRVCRNCGSLPQKISEVFNKEWLKKPVCFWFWIVWYLTNYIFENHMHILICLVVATIFQIRNCMLMSWDKKHENLRPFNKTFLLYTVILPSRNGIVQGLSIPLPSRGILMTKLWLFLRMTKGDTPPGRCVDWLQITSLRRTQCNHWWDPGTEVANTPEQN